jgi:cytochrome c peroxidase
MVVNARGVLLAVAIAASTACSSAGSDGPAGGNCDLPNVAGEDCERAHAMLLPEQLAPSPGNQYADNGDAAMLGFHLFFDSRLGSGVACVNCHAPELAFTDRLSVSKGKALGARNAPTVFNAARLTVMFWDGRADSLWSQPLFAIENALEMNSTRLELAHLVASDTDFHTNYEKAFGPLPDMSAWPAAGMPGTPAFDAMPASEKDQVNRVAANVGKAFDAYQRLNTTNGAPVDRFLKGEPDALVGPAQRGLGVFLEHHCDSCHSGPMLTDQSFHDAGFPALPGAAADSGYLGGFEVLQNNIFNLQGAFADPGPGVPGALPAPPSAAGQFRTPPLRNVTRTAPYGHDGALDSLVDVLAVHATDVSPDDQGYLLAFFETLNGEYPPKPWNNWPSPQ